MLTAIVAALCGLWAGAALGNAGRRKLRRERDQAVAAVADMYATQDALMRTVDKAFQGAHR